MEHFIHNYRLNGNGIILAIAASILLHVLIAVVVPNFEFKPVSKKPQALKIKLQQPMASPSVAEPLPPIDIPQPPKPKPIQKKPKLIKKHIPIKKPTPLPIKEPKPVEPPPMVEEVIAVAPQTEVTPEEVTLALVPVTQQTIEPKPVEPPPPPQPSQVNINNALNAYGSLLGRSIAKFKSYPKIAQRRGWQGTVLLELNIDSQGNVLSTKVRESSGYDSLDKEALKMVKKASPFPAPPKALQGRSFNLSVPVSFKLANG